MNSEPIIPEENFRQRLDAATPAFNDFALFCPRCEWIGQTNAVHARSSTCPECGNHSVHIWRQKT